MISFTNVSKSFGKHDVLVNCSFQVNAGERLGIIGANGTGKTTIFSLLLDFEHPDQGQISKPRNLRLGYLPQDVLQFSGNTVLAHVMDVAEEIRAIETELSLLADRLARPLPEEELTVAAERQSRLLEDFHRLGGYDIEARARKVLAGLGFTQEDAQRPVEEMSGGWAMRVALARILLAEPDLILLDEPTNHLDLDSLVWLEEYLLQSTSSLMLVSHDRTFLDRVIHRLLELENGRVTSYPGKFQHYLTEKDKQTQTQWASYRHQQEQIRQIKRFIDRNRARKDRARQVQSRLKMLDKMDLIEPPASPDQLSFRFPTPPRAPRIMAKLRGVQKGYDTHPVFSNLDLTIERGDRVALIGPNGAGKTTLLKLLAGKLSPDRGQHFQGSGVRIGYFAQQQLELLDPSLTVLESLSSVAGDLPQGQLRNLLGGFLFRSDDVDKLVAVLSGGERSRLLLCQILVQQVNFLLLDEPTNHLDIQGRRVLEQALKLYDGTFCLVSHDRHLINAVANKIMVTKNQGVELFHGNYDDFQEIWRKRLEPPTTACEKESVASETASISRKTKMQKRLEANWRNELHRQKAPLTQRLENLELRIDEMTSRLEVVSRLLSEPETYDNSANVAALNREFSALKYSLEEDTRKWEETAIELEVLEESFWQEKTLGH